MGSSAAAAFGEIDANQDQGGSDEQVAGGMLAEEHYGEDDDHHRLKIAEDRHARGGHVAQQPVKNGVGADRATEGHIDHAEAAGDGDGVPAQVQRLANGGGA